ncbi:zinc finger CCHC domain-containing protein 3-like isoform X2 [Ranitomeya imitator]|uniref:zinc finger CCHC domain-containing protein 3-like isoform X2 n=1 Tax=Ranitomeya imitator TaxID=111125 RepID=UPI0037E95D86
MKEDLTVSGSEGLMQSGSNKKAVKMETKGELSERPHGATSEGQTLDPQPGVSDPTAVSQEPQRLVPSRDTAGRMTDHLVNHGTQQSYARPVLQQQQRSAAVSGVTPQVPADNVASDVQDNPAVTGVVASGQQEEIGGGSSGNEWSHGSPFSSDTSDTVQALKRRNVVQFRHRGAREELPNRSFVIRELLCNQMGFRPTNIFALISLPDRQGYDVSFKVRSQLRHFWANFFKFRDVDGWNKFRFIPISKSDTVSVTINLWNEAVPPQYIVIWLQRHCDLMSDLTKDRDADGIWTGGWRVLVKLRQSQNFTHHLPVSFYIGREKGICFYAGQPRECYKCGRTGHLASACAYSVVKCSLCGEVGHAKAKCWNVQCILCGQIGCSQRDYPDSWHNEDLPVAAEDLEEEEALLLGSVLRPEPQSESSDSAQGARESSEGSWSPASVSNRENNESAQIKRRKKR